MIDEIDSICGRRSAQGSSSDREIARTMLALLTELDGFSSADNDRVKCVFCTNRPRSLDPAFLRPGRISRKITIPLPSAVGRYEILQIHGKGVAFDATCDLGRVVALTDGFNGADLKCLITEAGLCAIRSGRGAVAQEDLLEACRVMQKNKLLEGKTWDQGSDAMNWVDSSAIIIYFTAFWIFPVTLRSSVSVSWYFWAIELIFHCFQSIRRFCFAFVPLESSWYIWLFWLFTDTISCLRQFQYYLLHFPDFFLTATHTFITSFYYFIPLQNAIITIKLICVSSSHC